jgi:hypothetical protein
VRDKVKLTEALVAELPEDFAESVSVALRTWWSNIRRSGGMRLTDHGFYVLDRVLGIAHYGIDIKPTMASQRIVLTLDRKLQTPYYVEIDKRIPVRLHMFGSKEAMTAQLFGDLEKFLGSC